MLEVIFRQQISTTPSTFSTLAIFIIRRGQTNALYVTMRKFKRQCRELSDEHKQKISQSTEGKPKSAEHRKHISQGLKDYWAGVPHKPGYDALTMDDYLGISPDTSDEDGEYD